MTLISNLTMQQTTQIIKIMMLFYIMNKTHLLNNLIIIEFVSIAAMIMVMKLTSWMCMEMYLILFLMMILITESILGLSLLINLIRTHSNDFMKTSMVLKS